MSRRIAPLLVAALGLCACSAEPRSASYFEAHRDVAARVLADCQAGRHRGQECTNAEAAKVAADAEARMKLYRKSF